MKRNPNTHCVTCNHPMRTRTEPKAPGVREHGARGECKACVIRAKRRKIQPVGQPVRERVPREELVEEVEHLRSYGVTEIAELAKRIGMKPLSLERRLARHGMTKGLQSALSTGEAA